MQAFVEMCMPACSDTCDSVLFDIRPQNNFATHFFLQSQVTQCFNNDLIFSFIFGLVFDSILDKALVMTFPINTKSENDIFSRSVPFRSFVFGYCIWYSIEYGELSLRNRNTI